MSEYPPEPPVDPIQALPPHDVGQAVFPQAYAVSWDEQGKVYASDDLISGPEGGITTNAAVFDEGPLDYLADTPRGAVIALCDKLGLIIFDGVITVDDLLADIIVCGGVSGGETPRTMLPGSLTLRALHREPNHRTSPGPWLKNIYLFSGVLYVKKMRGSILTWPRDRPPSHLCQVDIDGQLHVEASCYYQVASASNQNAGGVEYTGTADHASAGATADASGDVDAGGQEDYFGWLEDTL